MLAVGDDIEYKFAVISAKGDITWEPCYSRRCKLTNQELLDSVSQQADGIVFYEVFGDQLLRKTRFRQQQQHHHRHHHPQLQQKQVEVERKRAVEKEQEMDMTRELRRQTHRKTLQSPGQEMASMPWEPRTQTHGDLFRVAGIEREQKMDTTRELRRRTHGDKPQATTTEIREAARRLDDADREQEKHLNDIKRHSHSHRQRPTHIMSGERGKRKEILKCRFKVTCVCERVCV